MLHSNMIYDSAVVNITSNFIASGYRVVDLPLPSYHKTTPLFTSVTNNQQIISLVLFSHDAWHLWPKRRRTLDNVTYSRTIELEPLDHTQQVVWLRRLLWAGVGLQQS